jgi:serine/threonine protein phosphatase PrpC
MEEKQKQLSEENSGRVRERDAKAGRLLPLLSIILTAAVLYLVSGGIPPTALKLLLNRSRIGDLPSSMLTMLALQTFLVVVAWVVLIITAASLFRKWFVVGPEETQQESADDIVRVKPSPPPGSTPAMGVGYPSEASLGGRRVDDPRLASLPSGPVWTTPLNKGASNGNSFQPASPAVLAREKANPRNASLNRGANTGSIAQPKPTIVLSREQGESRSGNVAPSAPPRNTPRVEDLSKVTDLDATLIGERQPAPKPAVVADNAPTVLPPAAAQKAPFENVSTKVNSGKQALVAGILHKARETSSASAADVPVFLQNEVSAQVEEKFGPIQFPLTVGYACHPGTEEQQAEPEDSILLLRGARKPAGQPASVFELFMLADGVSDTANREPTGQQACGKLSEILEYTLLQTPHLDQESVRDLLLSGMRQVSSELYQRNVDARRNSLTSMLTGLLLDSTLYVANVGENRAYLYRKPDGLVRITFDHSQLSARFDGGELSAGDIYRQPREAQFGRCLGLVKQVESDVLSVEVQPGDVLLFCTDGLWKLIAPSVLSQLVEQGATTPPFRPARFGNSLLQKALAGGGLDRLSLIVAQVQAR